MKSYSKFILSSLVVASVTGLVCPLSSSANSAQIKVTHSAHPFVTRTSKNFQVAVLANAPKVVRPVKPASPVFVRR
ncbi:MAG TPA: hypothetical protein VKY92_00925 [Verrucomicrobiae bacterium]|nr:hypothetical protein [Verrucomicrobiae bacterium]